MKGIFYSVIYDNNDNNQIISLLIKNQANINSFAKIEVLNQNYEIHSIFTKCNKVKTNCCKVKVTDPITGKTTIKYEKRKHGGSGGKF